MTKEPCLCMECVPLQTSKCRPEACLRVFNFLIFSAQSHSPLQYSATEARGAIRRLQGTTLHARNATDGVGEDLSVSRKRYVALHGSLERDWPVCVLENSTTRQVSMCCPNAFKNPVLGIVRRVKQRETLKKYVRLLHSANTIRKHRRAQPLQHISIRPSGFSLCKCTWCLCLWWLTLFCRPSGEVFDSHGDVFYDSLWIGSLNRTIGKCLVKINDVCVFRSCYLLHDALFYIRLRIDPLE